MEQKKKKYQKMKMEEVQLRNKSRLLSGSCTGECPDDGFTGQGEG